MNNGSCRWLSVLCGGVITLLGATVVGATAPDRLDVYNVRWDSPSANSLGSMPLGNGDIGVNAWVEPSGDLVLLLSKTDAWSGNGRLLKLGRVRIRMRPEPWVEGQPFAQELRLRDGEMVVRYGEAAERTRWRVWVDAQHPVVRIQVDSARPRQLEASLEVWRTEKRLIEGQEAHSAYGLHGGPDPILCYPDTVLADPTEGVVWYHRNEHSIWEDNLRHQGLAELIEQQDDPLLHHTFGGWIEGKGLARDGDRTLRSPVPREQFLVNIHVHAAQTPTAETWIEALAEQVTATQQIGLDAARAAHRDWWAQFWSRSWLFADGAGEAETVSRAYVLQRWVSASGGRGVHPIKFNGSIFTVDMDGFDPDYRRWGGPYWWQNTRLSYWPMLATGDFEMLCPLFRMYASTIRLAEFRTGVWFGHEGAFFPETMYFWGMFTNANYGWDRGNLPVGELTNRFIRREYTASPELLAMMLDYYDYTRDASFLEDQLLPLSDSLLVFWDQHYERNAEGRLVIYPAQALETLQDAKNPTPDIAGLEWVLRRLLELPERVTGGERRAFWTRLRQALPPLPMTGEPGERRVIGAEQVFGGRGNSENPELYAVFPFRLFGVAQPDLDVGRRTFEKRTVQGNVGWRQDDTQAALLGLTETARSMVVDRAGRRHSGSRFPVFWGPNFDWTPDQPHGGNLMMALQTMLLQADGERILLFPAWPRDWDVTFKLHAPRKTTIEGTYRGGQLESLTVTPASRRQDVQVWGGAAVPE